MMTATVTQLHVPLKPCPVCGGEPYVEECWTRGPWAVGCYRMIPTEHFVGVNGDDRADAIRNWNTEAERIGIEQVTPICGKEEK